MLKGKVKGFRKTTTHMTVLKDFLSSFFFQFFFLESPVITLASIELKIYSFVSLTII
jgi:hypothetical protein